jgi:hypothetical protein
MDASDQLHAPATLPKGNISRFPMNKKLSGSVWTLRSTEKYRDPASMQPQIDLPRSLRSHVEEVICVYVCASFTKEGLKHK